MANSPRFKGGVFLCAEVFHVWTPCSEATARWDVNWAWNVATENYSLSNQIGIRYGKG